MSSSHLDIAYTKSNGFTISGKIVLFIVTILIGGTALVSCEQNKLITVTVVDKLTKQPLDSVYIEIKAGKKGDYTKANKSGYTNSAGKFETHMMIGCSFGCYDIFMEYSKSGYTRKTELNRTDGVVELER